jgi:hypothetical protein
LPGPATTNAAPVSHEHLRLSVIADDANVLLGDLLSARLSADPSLEMVERQEFDRVLAEQKLTRQFAVDAANYSRVASLLRADALVLIRTLQVGGNKVVENRLIRVNPGLALDTTYSGLPIDSPPKWSERMSARVAGLVGKMTRTNAIALSLLNLRASVTSSADRRLDRSLSVMLSDRLTHEPQFVLLERAAMERVAFESRSPFWTGSYLVDGTVEPALDGSGAFTLSVRFQPTGRGNALVFTTSGRRANPAEAIDDLLAKINSGLAQSPTPQKRDLVDESERYLEEARWALAANQLAAAQSASEAAWALGSHGIETARLRVQTAMFLVRELCHQPAGKAEPPDPAAWLELSIHGLTVWQDTLQSDLMQGHPEELRKWLAFGLEMSDIAALTLIEVPTASLRVAQADRIESLDELAWESLEEIWTRSADLPGTTIGNTTSEKQAALARLLRPRASQLVPAVNSLLSRTFTKDNSLTRAHIRANLVQYWNRPMVMGQINRNFSQGATVGLPRIDETVRGLANGLWNSAAPEDRYVSALLAISRAGSRHEVTPADIERLQTSLFDMDKLLAEGGGIFGSYWERVRALDKLNGAPFFAINRTFSPDGNRMWDRNTPEHTEFRRKLFLRLCAVTKAPASDFQRLVSMDQYTPEQAAEVAAAQARLGGPATPRTPAVRGGFAEQSPPSPVVAPTKSSLARDDALRVFRLWTPFNLGLEILPEFRADFGTMAWAEGRIWLHGSTLDVHGRAEKHYLFAIEPGSLRTETILVPEPYAAVNARIAITPTQLLFVDGNFLALQDRAAQKWDIYKEIHAVGLQPLILAGDSLYLIVAEPPGNALIAFNLKQRTTEVLASTRRRPAASPFDDPGLEIKSVNTNQMGEIVVDADTFAPNVPAIERISQAWSPVQRTWREIHPRMPKSAAPRPAPERTDYRRVGTLGNGSGGGVVVHLSLEGKPPIDVPLDFIRQAGLELPESRYGPQNIRPDYCNSFPEGLVLRPGFGSGFWVILQPELDKYLRKSKSPAL